MADDRMTENNMDMSDETSQSARTADAAFSDSSPVVDAEVQRLSDEVKEANNRVLRAQAELENFRKRMRRDMEEERRCAALPLISDLLPIIDNLDRAIGAGEKNQSGDDLHRGVKMVQSEFLGVLERHHCRRLGNIGEAFNPNHHQALAQEPSSEYPAGTVTRVTQHGYQLHDRVVRPAQVFVSSGPPAKE